MLPNYVPVRYRDLTEDDIHVDPLRGQSEPVFDRGQIDEFLRHMGKEAEERFRTSLSQLTSSLKRSSPIDLLCRFYYSHLLDAPGADPERFGFPSLLQYHGELLQALVLMNELDEFAHEPEDQAQIAEEVLSLTMATLAMGLKNLGLDDTEKDRNKLALFGRLQIGQMAMRNWGYPSQVERLGEGLFSKLDEAVLDETGVRPSQLVGMNLGLVRSVDERLIQARRALESALRQTSIEAAIRTFCSLRNLSEEGEEYLLREAKTIEKPTPLYRFLSRYNYEHAREFFTFEMRDLQAKYGELVDEETLRTAVSSMSFEFGGLRDADPMHFLLDNPIWTKPFIRVEPGKFVCPIPSVLLSFNCEIVEKFVRTVGASDERFKMARSDFLESQVSRIMTSAFPSGCVRENIVWEDDNGPGQVEYENDVVVELPGLLIVVEAKSGQVSGPARRGAPDSVVSAVDKLHIEPSKQTLRLIRKLEGNRRLHKVRTRSGEEFTIDSSQIVDFVPLSVHWYDSPLLHEHRISYVDAGMVEPDQSLTPALHIASLEIVMSTLESEFERAHYLNTRAKLEQEVRFLGSEIDTLAYYLATAFKVLNNRDKPDELMLNRLSRLVDEYWEQFEDEGIDVRPKPRRAYGRLWREMLQVLAKNPSANSICSAMVLLDVGEKEQRKGETEFRALRIEAAKRKRANNISVSILNVNAASIVVFVAYSGYSESEVIEGLKSDVGGQRTVIVGADMLQRRSPANWIRSVNA